MRRMFSQVLQETIEISDEGKFELPSREYTAAELKKIAIEINRAARKDEIYGHIKQQEATWKE